MSKSKSESRTIRTANAFTLTGAATVASAVLAFILAEVDTLPLSEAAIAWVRFAAGMGSTAVAAGLTFKKLRMVTTQPIEEA